MTGTDLDDYGDTLRESPEPWYNRTPAVVGASVVGLLLITLIIVISSYAARQFNEPDQAPLNFVEPSFVTTSEGAGPTAAVTTTPTATSTSPPKTTDLPPEPPPSSSTETSNENKPPRTRDSQEEDDDDNTPRTSRRGGVRTNITRTFNPFG